MTDRPAARPACSPTGGPENLWPESVAALHSVADAYRLTDRLDEAIRTAREALAIDPDSISLRVLIANCLDTKGALDEAIPELREIVRLAPDRWDAQCRLGRTLATVGRAAEAIEVLRARLRRGPCESCQRRLLEELHFSGKHEEVLVEGEAAINKQPTSSAYYFVAESLLALRRHDLALTKALESVVPRRIGDGLDGALGRRARTSLRDLRDLRRTRASGLRRGGARVLAIPSDPAPAHVCHPRGSMISGFFA